MSLVRWAVLAIAAGFVALFVVTVDASGWHSACMGWLSFFGIALVCAGAAALTCKVAQ